LSSSGSSDGRSAARSVPYEASPTCSRSIIIREGTAGSSSVSAAHVKKEAAPACVKKEVKDEPAAEEDERP
jgi:hypothetical protein